MATRAMMLVGRWRMARQSKTSQAWRRWVRAVGLAAAEEPTKLQRLKERSWRLDDAASPDDGTTAALR